MLRCNLKIKFKIKTLVACSIYEGMLDQEQIFNFLWYVATHPHTAIHALVYTHAHYSYLHNCLHLYIIILYMHAWMLPIGGH